MARARICAVSLTVALVLLTGTLPAAANTTPQSLPFTQDWANIGLITANDDWSGVPGVVGFLGQDITTATAVDPQTLLTESTVANDVDVIANQTNTGIVNGGVAEFHLVNPVVALQGSGTADAPYLLLTLNTTGAATVAVAYNLRDIDGAVDNAVQPVALQYRVGNVGNFTNVPAAFVADATTGPSEATLVTPVSANLPAAAGNQPLVQVRIITSNAVGSDEWVGVDDISVTGVEGDLPPAVQSTTPAGAATNVALDTNIAITFSEAVNTTGTWFTIECATSGAHAATPSGGPTNFTLDPTTNFGPDESCTVTVLAANVTDQDGVDPPDNMNENYTFTFQTANVLVCGAAATPIHDIQGSGAASPMIGSGVTVEGVVVGDYQSTGEFGGFVLHEEDADVDGDTATSEGLFVFSGGFGVDVSVGDVVRVGGTVAEFFGLTEITSVSGVQVCSTGATVTPASVSLPVAALGDHERTEGMLVHFTQTLTATEVFTLARFGEVSLSGAGRLHNPTAVASPGAPALAVADLNTRSRILLDDGNGQQNIDPTRYPAGGLSAANTLRVGDTLPGLTAVMDFRNGTYRLQPVSLPIAFAQTNPRTAAPAAVGGNLKVASFNVLNYFNGDGLGGGFPTSRGATTLAEFNRQRDKIISALQAIDADVVGLMEIENDPTPNSAVEDLVAGLNAAMGAGTYAFIDTGVVGTDEIRVALIYKPAAVTPVGAHQVLTTAIDSRFLDTKNRPSLAQTFEQNATGGRLTVVVNHLKSKGSDCNDVGDPDTGDGQGNCNLTRTHAAEALVDWLATDPTGSVDSDYLIIGDLNSYTLEDPIAAITDAGYANLIAGFVGAGAYSYVFQGESGYLDHALASPSLTPQVTGTTEWHINPDEPIALDYNVEFKSPGQVISFYAPSPYRSSDHDPVVVGVQLEGVTLDGLCALTRDYSSSTKVANKLCDELAKAAKAREKGNAAAEQKHIDAFVKKVRKESGKAFTEDEAATLIRLAGLL